MLGNNNDGHSIFKGNSMTVLTPLETTGTSAGLPIEVPQCIRMIAFIDLKLLVSTGEAVCYFAAKGQLLTSSAIPAGAISMITDQSGQILHNTPHLRLLWRILKKEGNEWLQGVELNAQGDGTVTDAEFGSLNEQVDGRLR